MSSRKYKDYCENEIENVSLLLAETDESKSCSDDVDFKATTSKTSQHLLTGTLCGGFFIFGFVLISFGLALPTLAENMRLRIDEVSPSLATRGGGYLLGSILAGFVENKFNLQILLSVFLFLMGIALALIPVILNPISMYTFVGISAVGMGGYETLGNVLCLQLWGVHSEQVLQFLHFWYSLGAALTPFLLKPFLNEIIHKNESFQNNSNLNESIFCEVKTLKPTNLPYLSVPYLLFGLFAVTLAVLLLVFKFLMLVKVSDSKQTNTIANEGRKFRFGLLFLLFMFYFCYIGKEATLGNFLYTFVISDIPGMRYSKDDAAYLTSLLMFSLVVGQFVAIFLSRKYSPTVMLSGDLVGIGLSTLLIMLIPLYVELIPALFWLALSMHGLFTASIYASTFLWAEHYITVNARAASIIMIGGAVGEMVLPLPVGILIEDNPHIYIYFNVAYTAAMIILFLGMVKFASIKGQRIGSKTTQL